jgi:hypothetical protein
VQTQDSAELTFFYLNFYFILKVLPALNARNAANLTAPVCEVKERGG